MCKKLSGVQMFLLVWLLLALICVFFCFWPRNIFASEFEINSHCSDGWTINSVEALKIFKRVQNMTGITEDVGVIRIEIHPTKGDLFAKYSELYEGHGGFKAWYDVTNKTIYISKQTYQPKVLAHEFTHVLVTKKYGVKDRQINEDMPNWVEENYYKWWVTPLKDGK